MHRFYDGDFEKLVLHHERKVYNIAYGYLKNEADACDATQEAFIKIFKSISSFKGESSIETWIYRITANVCLDFLRKQKNHSSVSLDETFEDENTLKYEPPSNIGNPEEEVSKKLLAKSINDALSKLSEEHRVAITMREISGFSYAEIAQILKIEEGTVKSRIARARLKLREILLKDGNFAENIPSNRV